MPLPLQVAVGIIKNAVGEVLISYRHQHLHQGDLWEFPGGKIEPGESAEQALARELYEELNIVVEKATPTIIIEHNYPDLTVKLQVWTVHQFTGVAKPCEGQEIKWVQAEDLTNYDFPAANQAIITAARLPAYYAILNGNDYQQVAQNLEQLLANDIRLIQLRTKTISANDMPTILAHVYQQCQQTDANLLLNSTLAETKQLASVGLHLTSRDLLALSEKPAVNGWLAASCHNRVELLHAEKIGVDFAVLAPINKTKSHPNSAPLGWHTFTDWVAGINTPIYALGGMQFNDLSQANHAGAQGIAGISGFLEIK